MSKPHDAGEDGNDRSELVKHVSAEIIDLSRTSLTLRIRVAFSFLVAPYLILGSILIATKGNFTIDRTGYFWWAIAGAGICYMSLALTAAFADSHYSVRANHLRMAILRLAMKEGDRRSAIEKLIHNDRATKGVFAGHLVMSSIILLSVIFVGYAVSHIIPAPSKESPKLVKAPVPIEQHAPMAGIEDTGNK